MSRGKGYFKFSIGLVMSRNCEKCNDTGLIPFEKNGKIIPNAWRDCECKQLEPERYHQRDASDFDFPMSDTFRAASFEYCNYPDPGYIPPEPEASPPQVIEHRHSDMSKQDFASLRNLEGQVKYLQTKLGDRSKPQTKPHAYKGIK